MSIPQPGRARDHQPQHDQVAQHDDQGEGWPIQTHNNLPGLPPVNYRPLKFPGRRS